jgi:hypothetical protein
MTLAAPQPTTKQRRRRLILAIVLLLVGLVVAVLSWVALLGAPLSDRALNTCGEVGKRASIQWHWLPPAWNCTRTLDNGQTVKGRIYPWAPDRLSVRKG